MRARPVGWLRPDPRTIARPPRAAPSSPAGCPARHDPQSVPVALSNRSRPALAAASGSPCSRRGASRSPWSSPWSRPPRPAPARPACRLPPSRRAAARRSTTIAFAVTYRNREGSPADWVRVRVAGEHPCHEHGRLGLEGGRALHLVRQAAGRHARRHLRGHEPRPIQRQPRRRVGHDHGARDPGSDPEADPQTDAEADPEADAEADARSRRPPRPRSRPTADRHRPPARRRHDRRRRRSPTTATTPTPDDDPDGDDRSRWATPTAIAPAASPAPTPSDDAVAYVPGAGTTGDGPDGTTARTAGPARHRPAERPRARSPPSPPRWPPSKAPRPIVPLGLVATLVTTTGVVGAAMGFGVFGKRRRDGEQPDTDEVLAAAAASGVSVANAYGFADPAAAAAAAAAALLLDPELGMPRWRRPSLLEARRADPIREMTAAPRLTFDHGLVGRARRSRATAHRLQRRPSAGYAPTSCAATRSASSTRATRSSCSRSAACTGWSCAPTGARAGSTR